LKYFTSIKTTAKLKYERRRVYKKGGGKMSKAGNQLVIEMFSYDDLHKSDFTVVYAYDKVKEVIKCQ